VNAPATTELYPLSLHDALPILVMTSRFIEAAGHILGLTRQAVRPGRLSAPKRTNRTRYGMLFPLRRYRWLPRRPSPRTGMILSRSEEHTSELQSRENLVCRLLL